MFPTIECRVLFQPQSSELRFLPEGPYSTAPDQISWVAIQHGVNAKHGSINVLNTATGQNRTFDLTGCPGFAFPTSNAGHFVCGVDRALGIYDTNNQTWNEFVSGIDEAVDGTIVNDGVVFEDNLIFGCKDLKFEAKKAGLYLWRGVDGKLIQLRDDQICSNGKAVQRGDDGTLWLIDIDSPSKTVTRGSLDIVSGVLGEQEVLLDLTSEDRLPDGMILTPDHRSMIIAFYDPGDPLYGAARQYSLDSGSVEQEWQCPGSPRVTCPQLAEINGSICLVLTTAVEHMEAEQQRRYPNAGALFFGETDFKSIGDQPVYLVK